MTDNKNKRLRLDEILLYEGLVTEDQIKQALALQKEHGGRLGTHLLRNGWVDEAGLVRALARQLECEGVILSERAIPGEALQKIPSIVAIARTVVPFAYDPKIRELKVACDDPTSEELQRELGFIAKDCKIKLYIAAETALRAAVTKYYVLGDGTATDEPVPTGRTAQDSGEIDKFFSSRNKSTAGGVRGTILLVSDDQNADRHLRSILEAASFRVLACDSADDAIEMIGGHMFHTVFIRDTVTGDYIDLIDRLRKISPRTRVRYFAGAEHLLLDDEDSKKNGDLHIKNLELFTTLLSSKANLPANHSGTVGALADRLCRHIGLPDGDRLVVTNAAYIHDLSKFYYGDQPGGNDYRTQINLTVKLLDSLNYSPVVVGILKAMYINLRDKYTKRLPIETLGGNILTVVDIFCDTVPLGEKMSLDKFDKIRRKFDDLRGKLFLPEVAEAFLDMIQSEILSAGESLRYNQIMLYGADMELARPIAARLKNEGFRVILVGDISSVVDLFSRGNPDMMILMDMGSPARVSELIESVISAGIDIMRTPTFLLTDAYVAAQLTALLDKGIEDLISVDNNLNLLVVKIRKVRARIESQATAPHIRNDQNTVTGAMGNLLDMNLIDLLQALGPSRRTVKLAVSNGTDELVLYLQKGKITYAHLDELSGAEAVYEALGWTTGMWSIQPVTAEEILPSNNDYSNESILMEGCRLLDEKQKAARREH